MKIRILVFFLFIMSSFQLGNNNLKSTYEIDNYLADGETIRINDVLTNNSQFKLLLDSDYIKESDYELLLNSAIIKSFNSNEFDISDFFDRINNNTPYFSDHILDYFVSFEEADWITSWQPEGFYTYYHRLFQSKTVRQLLFKTALNILEERCKLFPKDYLDRVLIENRRLIDLTKNKDNYNNKLAGYAEECIELCYNSPCKTIDCSLKNWGEVFQNVHKVPICEGCQSWYGYNTHGYYLEGFIYRRVEIDNVPLSEIHNYLLKTEERLANIDKNNLDSYYFKINIDNNIYITISNDSYKLHNRHKYIILDRRAERITLNKDASGSYFLLWDYERGPYRALYNQDLELIN